MLNENAKKWVAALRSGKYKQATMYLRTPFGFCCLGVACDLYMKEKGMVWDGDDGAFVTEMHKTLPRSVMDWLGVNEQQGKYWADDGEHMLTSDNDETGKNFDQIADIIESEPEGLFVK